MTHARNQTYTIENSELLGRYLAAARDIKEGEVILREQPLLVGPRPDSTPICVGCYAPLAWPPFRRCSTCRVAPVCSAVCERAADHSQVECEALRRATDTSTAPGELNLIDNYQLLLPLRGLLLQRSDPTRWEALTSLEAHSEARRDSPVWQNNHETVVQVLRSWGLVGEGPENDELVQRVCGVCDVNSFEVRGPMAAGVPRDAERLRGVYVQAALIAHDCVGNTHLAVDDNFQMTIHASVPLHAGQPIYFNYTSALQGTDDRLDHLREGKYFECHCPRCSDPSELGTHVSSVQCVRCHEGFIARTSPTRWGCLACSHEFHASMVTSTVNMARQHLEHTDRRNPRAMETLLSKLLRTFHPNHAVLLELKQNLIALYRDIILRDPSYGRKVLQRKAELCRELLPVLAVIEPGISRLRGITLYELHVPLVLLANREYQTGDISQGAMLTRLQEAEGYLREAVTQLVYEPTHTPEGQLARIAMQELRTLRINMQDVKELADSGNGGKSGNKKRNRNRKK